MTKPRPCPSCFSLTLWRLSPEHPWVCESCHPPQTKRDIERIDPERIAIQEYEKEQEENA